MYSATMVLLLSAFVTCFMSQALSEGGVRTSRNQSWEDKPSSSDIIPGIVVVKLRHSYSAPGGPVVRGQGLLLNAFSESGVTSVARAFPSVKPLSDAEVASGKIDLSQIHFATIPPDLDPRDVASRLAQLPQVEYAEPKYYSYLCDVPNDSDFSATQQVYFDRMNVAAGWAIQKGSPSVVIATVDGGTDWLHPDLLPNIWINPGEDLNHNGIFDRFPAPAGDLNSSDDDNNGFKDDVVGWNFTNQTYDPQGYLTGSADHGTATASVFGAVTNNGLGMAGTSWNCLVMPVCAADPVNNNLISHGFEGITYAFLNGARVINCSWGHPNHSQYEQDIITAATDSGALIVAAVDDHHGQVNFDNIPIYPAAYEHVLSVGATTDTSDALAHFSQYGVNISVFAPGMRIRVATNDGSYKSMQGTSFSSPLVAGLAGLLVAAHPDWAPDQIAEQIRMTADPIDASNPDHAGSLGHGRVNFGRALSEIHAGVTIDTAYLHTPSGRTYFIEGDTLILSLRLKNILFTPAQNLLFSISADSALSPLGVAHAPTNLGPGVVDSVDFSFRVPQSLNQAKEVSLALGWTANSVDSDLRVFNTTLYATKGYWQAQRTLISIPLLSLTAVNKEVVWATGNSGGNSGGVAIRTIDGGDSWMNVTEDLSSVGAVSIFAVDSLHAWVGTSDGQIYGTTNGGSSWTHQIYPAPLSSRMNGFRFFDVNRGYALGDPGSTGKFVVLQTTDGGTTWIHFANEPAAAAGQHGTPNTVEWTNRRHGWFGGSGSLVWRTTDGGDTWSFASTGTGVTTALAMRDDTVGIAGTDAGLLARTSDGGASWQEISITGTGWRGAAFPAGSTSAWILSGDKVNRSDDYGVSWVEQPTDPGSGVLTAVSFVDPATGWVCTNTGNILRYKEVGLTTGFISKSITETPARYLLEQNYPNPFNPTTSIEYRLSNKEFVTLKVFDLLGREVAALVNERKAPGSYSVRFDGKGLASGVYFYRLTVGGFVETRKMILLR